MIDSQETNNLYCVVHHYKNKLLQVFEKKNHFNMWLYVICPLITGLKGRRK